MFRETAFNAYKPDYNESAGSGGKAAAKGKGGKAKAKGKRKPVRAKKK